MHLRKTESHSVGLLSALSGSFSRHTLWFPSTVKYSRNVNCCVISSFKLRCVLCLCCLVHFVNSVSCACLFPMKHKKLLLNSKIATLTQKNMPPYISRVITIILIRMLTLKNYGLTSFQKPWLWCVLFFFKVCPWIQLPFLCSVFFIPFKLCFFGLKKFFH